jgi:acetyl esterase/lipase
VAYSVAPQTSLHSQSPLPVAPRCDVRGPARRRSGGRQLGAYLSASVVAAEQSGPINAVVGLSGFYGHDPSDGDGPAAKIIARPDTTSPAFLVVHGTRETYVDVSLARAFVDALRDGIDAPVAYAELPGGQHSFDLMRSPRFLAVVDGVEAFIDRLR